MATILVFLAGISALARGLTLCNPCLNFIGAGSLRGDLALKLGTRVGKTRLSIALRLEEFEFQNVHVSPQTPQKDRPKLTDLHINSTTDSPTCEGDLVAAVTNASTVHGLLHSLSSTKGPLPRVLYIPSSWAQHAWVNFILSSLDIDIRGVPSPFHNPQCVQGSVSVLPQPAPSSLNETTNSILALIRRASAKECGSPRIFRGEANDPALILEPQWPTRPLAQSSNATRFLLRRGLPYEHVWWPPGFCNQASLLEKPWKAIFTSDGPHLLYALALLPKTTPLFVLFPDALSASFFCATAKSQSFEAFAVWNDRVLSCNQFDGARAHARRPPLPNPPPLSFPSADSSLPPSIAVPHLHTPLGQLETLLRCTASQAEHCRHLYRLETADFSERALDAARSALPQLFSPSVLTGPISLSSYAFTHVHPRLLAKTIANGLVFLSNFFKTKKPTPAWTELWTPSACPPLSSNSSGSDFLDLLETPYDPAVWREHGDASKPPPRLLIVTYNTVVTSASSCRTLMSAQMMGYNVNLLGFWRLKAFDYMSMTGGGFKEDKTWFGMMLARDLVQEGRPDDLVFAFDGTDVIFQLPPTLLVKRFLLQKAGMVVSAESACWPYRKEECEYFDATQVPSDLRDSGLPFVYPNTGGIMAYARDWMDVFFTCYQAKVEATHRGEKVPYYIYKDSDQKFFYYVMLGCPPEDRLRSRIKLDYFQEIMGNLAAHYKSYEWDPDSALWHLKAGVLGSDPRALTKEQGSIEDRSPVMLHFPGKAKINYLGWNRMSTTLLQGFEGAESPKRAFQCSEINLVEFRRAYVGEVCPKA